LDGDISGSPCTPWSRLGSKKEIADPRAVLLLIWLEWVLMVELTWAIHENVIGFDTSVIDKAVGTAYSVYHITANPADVGFAFIKRPRVYSVLLRRGAVRVIKDVRQAYARICNVFLARRTMATVSHLFIVSDFELLKEENMVRQKRRLSALTRCTPDWRYLLSDSQKRRCLDYLALWREQKGTPPEEDPACIFNLRQDPRCRPNWTCRHGALPTITRSGGLLWSPMRKRWLLVAEVACAMGFPCQSEMASAALLPADCTDYSISQIGNSMHTACVGSVIAATLSCIAPVDNKY